MTADAELCKYYAVRLFHLARKFKGFMGRFCDDCKEKACRHHLESHGAERVYFLAVLEAQREAVSDG